MALGYSFAPTTDNADLGKRGGQPPYRTQDPIRTLNFQLPQVTGANSISPLAGQTRAGSSIGQAVLQSVLKTVLGADAASAFLSGSPASAAITAPQPPRMSMPGAPVSAAPRVRGGVTGGMTMDPGPELNSIPNFSAGQSTVGGGQPRPPAPTNPTFLPGSGRDPIEGGGMVKVPEPNPSDVTGGGTPDFGRGPGTFSGGMDNEARLNNRSPLFYDKFGG